MNSMSLTWILVSKEIKQVHVHDILKADSIVCCIVSNFKDFFYFLKGQRLAIA